MNRSFRAAAALLLLFAAPVSAEDSKPFRLGVIIALSGEAASAGESVRNGITMALEKLSPDERAQLEIIYEDDRLSPKNAVTAFNKLVAADKIDAAVTLSSGTSKAVAPLAEQKKIPLIAIATDPAIVRGKSWVVNFWVTPTEEARHFVDELKRRGIHRLARISAAHDGTLAMKNAFDEVAGGAVQIVLDEELDTTSTDFKSIINKVKQRSDVDAVWVNLFFGQTGIFAKQAKELALRPPLVNVETFESPEDVKVSQGSLVGSWYIQADMPAEEFTKVYLERFPGASLFAAGNAHDVILLTAAALKQGRSRERLNSYLHSVQEFQGAMGRYSATGDNRFSLPATVKVVTKDGFEKAVAAPGT